MNDLDFRATAGVRTVVDDSRWRQVEPFPIPCQVFSTSLGMEAVHASCTEITDSHLEFETTAELDMKSEVQLEFETQDGGHFSVHARLLAMWKRTDSLRLSYSGYFRR